MTKIVVYSSDEDQYVVEIWEPSIAGWKQCGYAHATLESALYDVRYCKRYSPGSVLRVVLNSPTNTLPITAETTK